VGAPSPSPSAAATSAAATNAAAVAVGPLDQKFLSDRYGYTVDYPSGWTIKPATTSWAAGAANNWGSGINDELSNSRTRFSGAAQILTPGQTADEWLAAYGSPVASLAGSGDPATWRRVMIDGVEGRMAFDGVAAAGGALGGVTFDVVVVSEPFAYNFNMDGLVDRTTFEAVLATVKLPIIPDGEKSYTSTIEGYSINRPGNWSVIPATDPWTGAHDPSGKGVADPFADRLGPNPLVARSTKLPTGMSFDDWYATYDQARYADACGHQASEEPINVDGVDGRLDVHCPELYLEAVVPSGGRAYTFTLWAPASRSVFMALLSRIDLTPETARN
jgi:hypothetical protein